ncbi:MAG TPA: hypothetical protein VNI61_02685 [Gemmatimonadales bacterium]|nr:hypothetical protein [Gemmatimonadales bacterium]
MMSPARHSGIGRALAILVLASYALSFVPPDASPAPDPMGCMEHHSLPPGLAIQAASHPAGCHSGPMDGCSAMPGCAAVSVALVATPVPVPASPAPIPAGPPPAPSLHGLLASGPPTPPPDF